MFFTTVTSVLALASFASAAAPSVIYPHQGTVWENTWFHNVTWAPQSGTGNIMLTHGGTMTTLINNVDLSTGRVVIQVPKSVMQAQDWIVQIAAGGDTSSSNAFAIGPPSAVAPGGGSSSASGSASNSATGSAASASSISASAGSSAAASAASSISSMASMSMSGSSVVSSAASSISSEFNSASASAQSQFSSLINSASSAGQSSLSSVLNSASESAASKSSSIQASATAPASSSSSASSGAAPLGFSMFGATIAAGLVAITTLSGALVL